MNLFVSYTRRDGFVTNNLLQELNIYLCSICIPFIHAVEEPKITWQQLAIIFALVRSHAILLIESPGTKRSPWVRFELFFGRLLLLPVIRLNTLDLEELRHNNFFQRTAKSLGR